MAGPPNCRAGALPLLRPLHLLFRAGNPRPYRRDPEEVAEELRKRLILGNGPRPEFIPAPDWSFYYPGHARLVVVKFPDTYCDVLRDLYELSRATASDPMVN